jgi:hypothetical protein
MEGSFDHLRMNQEPSFYLASVDSYPTLAPRSCFVEERLSVQEERDDYLRVRIEPPIQGQPFGRGERLVKDVVLATRYAGTTLPPISEWPMTVFICRIVNDSIRNSGKASAQDVEVMLIGELYNSLSAAQEALKYKNSCT